MSEFKQNYFNFLTSYPYELTYETAAKSLTKQKIENELQALRQNFTIEENAYVEDMLSNNPVIVERRKLATENIDHRSLESTQRAESCRKSRINNKVKKARFRFRHQFANQKMLSSAYFESRLEQIIDTAELQLLQKGVSPEKLRLLRLECNMPGAKTSSTLPIPYWQQMRLP